MSSTAKVRVYRRKGKGIRPLLFSMSLSGCFGTLEEVCCCFVFSRGQVLCAFFEGTTFCFVEDFLY